MNELILHPHESLFFRDSRPMGGANSGHGARFPEPHVLNGALHAACHRAFGCQSEVGYSHAYRNRNRVRSEKTNERFGSLRSVGPFPVSANGEWYMPAPADFVSIEENKPALKVLSQFPFNGNSSLPEGLMPIVSTRAPNKTAAPRWLKSSAFEKYLNGDSVDSGALVDDTNFFTTEHAIGISIDPITGSAADGEIYSRSSMRFREGCTLGAYVESGNQHGKENDLISQMFPALGLIRIGGEGRVCRVFRKETDTMPRLPLGVEIKGCLVKWVLLSPCVFPAIRPTERHPETPEHPGGWLPTWIDPNTLKIKLLDGPGRNKAERLKLEAGLPIDAKLVGALILGKQVISGWAQSAESAVEDRGQGARSTLLGVPAGSIYYFEANNIEQAKKLAGALNWHGRNFDHKLRNRRSTLLGEKGFGIGVCGNWNTL